MLLFGHLCHKMELYTHSVTVLRLFFCVYVFDFSLVTLCFVYTCVKGVQFYDMYSTPFLWLYTPVWSCVQLSHNFHIFVLGCACSLAGIGSSCPSRASCPCRGCLCPCSLSCLDSVVAGADLGFCVLGYCHCSLKRTLDIAFVLVCMLHPLFGIFQCSLLDLDWNLLICTVGRLWCY